MAEPGAFPPAKDRYDVIVLGAGAAGMTAASVAAAENLKVLLVEKSALVGGTTARSGGMMWLPGNRKTAEAGHPDSLEAARKYLEQSVPEAATSATLIAFVDHADEAIGYLEEHTEVRVRPVVRYPDYYPAREGAAVGGRVLEPSPFDARALGPHFALLEPPLPEFTLFGGMMVSRADIPHFRRVGRSLGSTARVADLLARHLVERMSAPRGTTLHLGAALAARLFLSCLQLGVDLCVRTTAVVGLPGSHGSRQVILTEATGRTATVTAARAVVIATGGFSHDAELRAANFPTEAGKVSATNANATGDGVRLGLDQGGHLGQGNESPAFWTPASTFTRSDGTGGVFPHTVTDRGKPGVIALNREGRRFVTEAASYHDFVLAMLREENRANPCYLICDSRALWKYGLGRVKPSSLRLGPHIASGYLFRATTVEALAAQLKLDLGEAGRTVMEFNRDAAEGVDRRFGKGSDIYQRHLGDADHTPNPCLAPIVTPPFYAVVIHPADLGTATGLVADEHGRVLDAVGAPIAGLYCCGNDMNSVMKGNYPGPGITLGPALTFGYLVARRIASEI